LVFIVFSPRFSYNNGKDICKSHPLVFELATIHHEKLMDRKGAAPLQEGCI